MARSGTGCWAARSSGGLTEALGAREVVHRGRNRTRFRSHRRRGDARAPAPVHDCRRERSRRLDVSTSSSSSPAPSSAGAHKFDGISKILNQVVTATSIPYVTYVPEPATVLHRLDARLKQVLAVGCLVVAARGTIETRLALCLGIGAASVAFLPKTYSVKQLLGVLKLCLVVGFFTLLAADAVTVPLQQRLPSDPALLGLAAFEDATSYKYTFVNFGLIKITRRSVNLAAAACALQFATIQSTVMCLTTTSPEELTKAYTQFFLLPLKWLRVANVSELSLSVLLSFRFLGLIFEELQNVAKGMLARNINWRDLKLVARIDIGTTLITKAVNNLLSISNQIARSMMVRGYNSKSFSHPHLVDVKEDGGNG